MPINQSAKPFKITKLQMVFDNIKIKDIEIDLNSIKSTRIKKSEAQNWTKLSYFKCPNCPLESESFCPAAQVIYILLSQFQEITSYEKGQLEVTDQIGRKTLLKTTSQHAAFILMRMALFHSNCPIFKNLNFFIKDLQPLATEHEFLKHLSTKFLLMFNGNHIQTRKYIEENIESLRLVDDHLAKRIRCCEMEGDSVINALIINDYMILSLDLSFSKIYNEIIDEIGNALKKVF